MKLYLQAIRLLAPGLVFWATAVGSQPEQWLTYRKVTQGVGFSTLQTTTNIPLNVPLPPLGRAPRFAVWYTPLDKTGGRWMCFDQSKKNGPYDRLYLDCNGDGRLDDETPVTPSRTDTYGVETSRTFFGPIRVTLQTPDGPVAYHLLFRVYMVGEQDLYVYCRSGGWYEGKVDFGGKKLRVQLTDRNVNGTFNDIWTSPDGPDEIAIEGENSDSRALGKFVEVDGELFEIDVAVDGAYVKVKKAQDVKFGQVKVSTNVVGITFIGPNGEFRRVPERGICKLPAGTYAPARYTIARNDTKGVTWRLEGDSFPESAVFDLGADQTVDLVVGEPVRLELTAFEGTNEVAFSLRFVGRLGERVLPYRRDENPRALRLGLRSLTGSYRATNNFVWG